ncbi:PREDICTED: immediate early response 3-interacting protein 1 isoform X2 [Atta colombica]|uniref:immediate early response 3-interacting protein 1 isoform X2 n=1 Tax=Atta colombica TaxID=520822 RepID=UPI00084CA7BA|nr:PREDICTED: immediate early response 3-interacting protein 1 isoform X2 [Atta colombica]
MHNMAFTLWTLFEATLLCLNAVCVLNEERFLAKVGWASWQNVQGFGEPPTAKSQILNLIKSIRTVMRVPLIFFNILTLVVKLVLG